MSCGEPLWVCPFCSRINVQMYCNCPSGQQALAPDFCKTTPEDHMKKKQTISEELDDFFSEPSKPKNELNDLYEEFISKHVRQMAKKLEETHDDVIAKLHREASSLETDVFTGSSSSSSLSLASVHTKMDIARALRMAANYLNGVQAT